MSTIWEVDNDTCRLFTKGATDYILEKCGFYIDADGTKRAINQEFKTKLLATMKDYAGQSLRTLLITYKDIKNTHTDNFGTEEELETDLCILGLAGIKDPLRPEIVGAV